MAAPTAPRACSGLALCPALEARGWRPGSGSGSGSAHRPGSVRASDRSPGPRNSPPGAPSTPRRGQKRPSIESRAPPHLCSRLSPPPRALPPIPPQRPRARLGPARVHRPRAPLAPPAFAACQARRGPQLSARRPRAGWPGVTLDRDYVQGRTLSNQVKQLKCGSACSLGEGRRGWDREGGTGRAWGAAGGGRGRTWDAVEEGEGGLGTWTVGGRGEEVRASRAAEPP